MVKPHCNKAHRTNCGFLFSGTRDRTVEQMSVLRQDKNRNRYCCGNSYKTVTNGYKIVTVSGFLLWRSFVCDRIFVYDIGKVGNLREEENMIYTVKIEQTFAYPKRMKYVPKTDTFIEKDCDSLSYVCNVLQL